jgi:hypothetical protein
MKPRDLLGTLHSPPSHTTKMPASEYKHGRQEPHRGFFQCRTLPQLFMFNLKHKRKPKVQANTASWTPPEGGGPPPPHSSSSSLSSSQPPSTPCSPHSSSSSLSSPLPSSSISSPPPSPSPPTLPAANAAFAAANSRLICNLYFWASTRCFRSRFFSCRLIFFFGPALAAARRASTAAIWARSVGGKMEGSSRVVGAGVGGAGGTAERAVHPC